MTYADVLDWLYAQLPMFQRTGPVRYRIDLAKTHALCAALGNPQDGLEVIHIAGTNGKGSVSATRGAEDFVILENNST